MRPNKRWDKLTVERPRSGGTRGEKTRRDRARYKDIINAEGYDGIPIHKHSRKDESRNKDKRLNDLIGPLKRWAQTMVGKHINEAMSSLHEKLKDKTSTMGAHVWGHAKQMFYEDNLKIENGQPYYYAAHHRERWLPLYQDNWRALYVHPTTGIIHRAPRRPVNKKKKTIPQTVTWNDVEYYQHNSYNRRGQLVGTHWYKRAFAGLRQSNVLVSRTYNEETKSWDVVYEQKQTATYKTVQLNSKEWAALLAYLNTKYDQ